MTTKGGSESIIKRGLDTNISGFVTQWKYVKDVEDPTTFNTMLYKQSLWSDPAIASKFNEGAYILKIESETLPQYFSPFTNRINGVPQWIFEGGKIPPSQIDLLKKVGDK